MSELFNISEESDLEEVAAIIAKKISHNIVLLIGEMGAGKTTFVKYLIRELIGYEQVNSPTFSLVNEYAQNGSDKIYHMDLYRLESFEEALNIGIEEYLDSGCLTIIEWPQIIENILPENLHVIDLKMISESKRTLSFS